MRRLFVIIFVFLFAICAEIGISPSKAETDLEPTGLTVASGANHSCSIDEQGAISCWGMDGFNITNPPSLLGIGRSTQIVPALGGTCALTEMKWVHCWGPTSGIPNLTDIIQISGSYGRFCALDSRKMATCWGKGDEPYSDVLAPAPSDIQGHITSIVAGDRHACAIYDDPIRKVGGVTCWGGNFAKERVQVAGAVQISSFRDENCALSGSGKVKCWGWALPYYHGEEVPSNLGKVIQITTGDGYSCAVNDEGRVHCWGRNDLGQSDVPSGLSNIIEVAAGLNHTCAVDSEGKTTCWGWNGDGQNNVSASLGKVLLNKLSMPNSVPVILGTHKVGSALKAIAGDWTPKPDYFTYQWFRDGVALENETGSEKGLVGADYQKNISVEITGHKILSLPVLGLRSAEYYVNEPGSIDSKLLPFIVSGDQVVGGTLLADDYYYSTAMTVNYQWLRDGMPIPNAVSRQYQTSPEDYQRKISVQRTSSLYGYISDVLISNDYLIRVGVLPSNPPIPTFSGQARTGNSLKANPGDWDSGVTFTYQWFRDGVPIPDATLASYQLGETDCMHLITLKVTGSLQGYSSQTMTSDPTVIALGMLTRTQAPKIKGVAKVNQTLVSSFLGWDDGVKFNYQWLRNGVAISKATTTKYKITSKDKGKKISIRITGKKPGYEPVTRTSTSITVK